MTYSLKTTESPAEMAVWENETNVEIGRLGTYVACEHVGPILERINQRNLAEHKVDGAQITSLQAEVEALRKGVLDTLADVAVEKLKVNTIEKERDSARAELEKTRRELEKTKARLETYWKKGDENFATLVALRQALTTAEQRAEGLSALNQAHAEHLAAARADFDRVADERDTALQRAEGAVRHDEQMNVALGKLAPKGTWLCEVLENIWRAPSQAEAVKIAEAAAPEVKAGGLWSGPRVRENLEEAERQRDTAIRERDELKAKLLDSWNIYYLNALDEQEKKQRERRDDSDSHGMNFFQGTHAGLVEADIYWTAALAAKTTEGGVRP